MNVFFCTASRKQLKVKVNSRITSTKIIENVNINIKKTICAETARKLLRKAGYHGRVARKKPCISLVNRQKRIEFAHNYINKSPKFWRQVIFSDESKFCIFGIKGRQIVWRKSGTGLEKKNLVGTVKHGEWSSITAEETDKLARSMPNRLSEVLKQRGYPTKY